MTDVTIDACVMRSAGITEDVQAIAARTTLDEVYKSSACVLADTQLVAEWEKHESTYAISWRAAMETQARIINVSCNDDRWGLKGRIEALDCSRSACALKDVHLVMTALTFSSFIVSSERASRGIFVQLALGCDALLEVYWAHPDEYSVISKVCNGMTGRSPTWSLAYS